MLSMLLKATLTRRFFSCVSQWNVQDIITEIIQKLKENSERSDVSNISELSCRADTNDRLNIRHAVLCSSLIVTKYKNLGYLV